METVSRVWTAWISQYEKYLLANCDGHGTKHVCCTPANLTYVELPLELSRTVVTHYFPHLFHVNKLSHKARIHHISTALSGYYLRAVIPSFQHFMQSRKGNVRPLENRYEVFYPTLTLMWTQLHWHFCTIPQACLWWLSWTTFGFFAKYIVWLSVIFNIYFLSTEPVSERLEGCYMTCATMQSWRNSPLPYSFVIPICSLKKK